MRYIFTSSLLSEILVRLKNRVWPVQLITKEELLERSREAEVNYKKGRVKVLKDVDGLDKTSCF